MVKVLLVDDFDETLESLELVYGFHPDVQVVGRAHNAEEMWDILGQQQVDYVSLDIQLGAESGLELCRQIRKKYPKIFVVMCSVEASDRMQKSAIDAGASYFLAKPIGMNEINHAVSSCLKWHGGEDSLTEQEADDLLRLLDSEFK
ncbi:response regulator transcription factor [Alicyclobacillus herbarius]|uniref:response regulator transcription factor n=1 Tax=Alicyclobacillus herbarius TaxID=122960 RepID=UPI0004170173|nr:response regulator transcription factor [Alicyclobacillus herbarius]